ncbi:hypothetical protein G6F65_020679 [Rhizopus arrhizus]|nr:hypothetical protein G6F65_020679 [Rhizopus arrhizus]
MFCLIKSRSLIQARKTGGALVRVCQHLLRLLVGGGRGVQRAANGVIAHVGCLHLRGDGAGQRVHLGAEFGDVACADRVVQRGVGARVRGQVAVLGLGAGVIAGAGLGLQMQRIDRHAGIRRFQPDLSRIQAGRR